LTTIGLACATRASFLSSPSSSTRNNGEAHQGRAGPRPLAWRKTILCALTNRLPRVRHAQSSPAPVREPPQPPPTRIGAEALNATDDEKIRELVMALVGQEPGDEPRRPRTPLLAPFITCSVLLRVNNILFRRRITLSEGAWGCRPLSVVRWQPSRARRGGVHGGRQARGATRCRPGPAALCTPSNPSPNRTRPLIARPNAGWSHSYRARGAWPNSNPILTLNLPIPNPT